jgi:O-antigen/teichoic acid export membrane protein
MAHSPLLSLIFQHQDLTDLQQVRPAVTVFFMCLGLTLPLTVVEKVQAGAQESYLTNLWQTLANLLTCVALWLVSRGQCHLYSLVLAYSGVPILVKIGNFVSYFQKQPWLAPALKRPDWQTGRYLIRSGASFVILQSSVALGYTCDNVILAAQLGGAAVAAYDVVQRLFNITVLAELSIAPMWGAFGEALSRGDIEWVRTTFRRSLLANSALAGCLCVGLLAGAPTVIRLWTHGKVHPGWMLLVAFALWRVFNVLQANLSVLLNHETTLRQQTKYFLIAAIVSFFLKFPLLHLLGPGGVVIATVASFGLLYAVPCLRMASALLKPVPVKPQIAEIYTA